MPYTKKWNEIIPETKEILKISLPTLVNDCLNFKNKNLILFDLETLGFHPTFDYEQIIEIAAMCVRGETLESYDKFERKIILSDSAKKLIDCSDSVERYNWEKRQKRRGKTAFTSPSDILEFTRYHKTSSTCVSEKMAITKFFELIVKTKNPVLIAHNTEFDINYLMVRGKRYGLKFPQVEILDTLKISRFFFIPLLKALNNSQEESEILNKLKRHQKRKIHYSSRLGDLASALQIDASEWHTASADVRMMFELFLQMISFFRKNVNLDIDKQKQLALYETNKKFKRQSLIKSK